jgi:hypothetical protein
VCLTDFGLAKDFSMDGDFQSEDEEARASTICGTQGECSVVAIGVCTLETQAFYELTPPSTYSNRKNTWHLKWSHAKATARPQIIGVLGVLVSHRPFL